MSFLLTAGLKYLQANLPPCQKPPSSPHCFQQWLVPPVSVRPRRPQAFWPPAHSLHGKRHTCNCTPSWSWSFFVWFASCSCLLSSTRFVSTAPSVRGLKTHTEPTHVTWSARMPPVGTAPLIVSRWGMSCDWNIRPGPLICLSVLGWHSCCSVGMYVLPDCDFFFLVYLLQWFDIDLFQCLMFWAPCKCVLCTLQPTLSTVMELFSVKTQVHMHVSHELHINTPKKISISM